MSSGNRTALDVLRDRAAGTVEFRTAMSEVATAAMAEAAGTVGASEVTIVIVLRAGLGMLDAAAEVFDGAPVVCAWAARDENTLDAELRVGLPRMPAGRTAIICDPMLATGSSAAAVIDAVEAHGTRVAAVVCICAAPEGIAHLAEHHPDVDVVAYTVDDGLDEHGYIVPGLGDAGDRWCGTERP